MGKMGVEHMTGRRRHFKCAITFFLANQIQKFQNYAGLNQTHVKSIINYELPTSGKIANIVTGNQA